MSSLLLPSLLVLIILLLASPLSSHSLSLPLPPSSPSASSSPSSPPLSHYLSFIQFMKTHHRTYPSSALPHRFATFSSTLRLIAEHNARAASLNLSYTLGVTANADLTAEEYRQQRLGYRSRRGMGVEGSAKCDATSYGGLREVEGGVDWRLKGAVTGVKDQGSCGACWAFSATGAMEGAWALSKKKGAGSLLSLSEQQLLDCSGGEGNEGCSGGYTSAAFDYIQQAGGACSEADYTYVGYVDDACHDADCTPVITISSHACVDGGNETALLLAVTRQPVAIAIEADQPMFQHYSGGVMNDPTCGQSLNHAVLIVGYGTDGGSGLPYWLVKNSWGQKWGLGGYAMVVRGKNQCGLAAEPYLPLVADS